MFIAIFVICIVAVIMFHEFGHFATAKLFGMKCEKFFLGFGPTLWSVRKGETEYGVKAIPAGGFVKITGMSPFEQVDPTDAGRTFHEQAAWKRAIVLVAGSATHFIVAIALLFSALAFVGEPRVTTTIDLVTDGSPAAAAGLRPGDEIVAVGGQRVERFEDAQRIIAANEGETIPIQILRDGQMQKRNVTIAAKRPDGKPGGFLGVSPAAVNQRLPVGEALERTIMGDFSVFRFTWLTVQGLAQAFSPQGLSTWFDSIGQSGPRDANGPIGVVGIGQAVNAVGSRGDVFLVLWIIAQLNIGLGTLNLLPLPPLDGGHLAVLGVEETVNRVRRLRGRSATWHMDPSVLTPLAFAVILFFVVIGVTALYADITNPVSELFQ
jgi:membrane-associated protease RseP (regulator of RpoE activity)